jgi:hypothetical protein
LGGSAAYAMLSGNNGVDSELKLGVGWQDPVIIYETGLCVWRSGPKPILDFKINPEFLIGKMAILWTQKSHITPNLVDMDRNYDLIFRASIIARDAAKEKCLTKLSAAINMSYDVQLDEGMISLPSFGEIAKKYCGGGHGGYAVYIFNKRPETKNGLEFIEPYLKQN